MNIYCHNCAEEWDAFYAFFIYKESFVVEDYRIISCPGCKLKAHNLSLVEIKRIDCSDDMIKIVKNELEELLKFLPRLKLTDIASVCSYCKKIKDGNEYLTIGDYSKKRNINYYEGAVEERLLAKFFKYSSHGVCPDCFKKLKASI